MWFEDLSPCSYFGKLSEQWLRAVGWLERGHEFRTGQVRVSVLEKLEALWRAPFAPCVFMGIHRCGLCQVGGPAGVANLWVPGNEFLYVCPELILHYIRAHEYLPPDEFCEAVLNCPLPG